MLRVVSPFYESIILRFKRNIINLFQSDSHHNHLSCNLSLIYSSNIPSIVELRWFNGTLYPLKSSSFSFIKTLIFSPIIELIKAISPFSSLIHHQITSFSFYWPSLINLSSLLWILLSLILNILSRRSQVPFYLTSFIRLHLNWFILKST